MEKYINLIDAFDKDNKVIIKSQSDEEGNKYEVK